MLLTNVVLKSYFKAKGGNVQKIINEPYLCQEKCLHFLLRAAKHTVWGKQYQYNKLNTYQDFRENTPINTYESLYPYIEQSIKGERNVLWRGKTNIFSKSSGTSGSRSKFIPVSLESLIECNYKGGKDSLSLYVKNRPDTRLFTGKTLSLTGSLYPSDIYHKAICGDISAILIKYIPDWANRLRTPKKRIALLPNWNEKLDLYAHFTKQQNITGLSGVPSWILLVLKHIMKIEKINSINDIWPNLELFLHGGVNFNPYYPIYKSITSNNLLWYWQIYNASEGYFATQDMPNRDDMLLLLNNNVFYEFISLSDFISNKLEAINIENVKPDVNYVLLVSTNAGLWRYIIGDVVRFTSTNPYRIIITGRTSHYINAFGEELIMDNVDKALSVACKKTNATIIEFTAAPIYFQNDTKAAHEWCIEFKTLPKNFDEFITILDNELMKVNSDYEAKRSFDLLLQRPIIHSVPQGTFLKWMTLKGKLGGQHKVVRLANNRNVIDEIKKIIQP